MLKKYLGLTLVILLIQFSSYAQQNNVSEGTLIYRDYFINLVDSSHGFEIKSLQDKILFKDSCVIVEIRSINSVEIETGNGNSKRIGYDLYKYTYLDLRNMKCQDYYSFTDTSMPVCNYYLKQDEAIAWKFYADKKIMNTTDALISLSDTVVDNQHYKRIRTIHRFGNDHYENEYFLNCNMKKSIFHIDKAVDEKFPLCVVTRADLIDLTSPERKAFEFKILKERLSPGEKNIFKIWAQNAKNTKLPLLSLTEIKKAFPIYLSPMLNIPK